MKHKQTIKQYVPGISRSRRIDLMLLVVSSLLTLVTRRNNAFLAIMKIDRYWASVVLHMKKGPTE